MVQTLFQKHSRLYGFPVIRLHCALYCVIPIHLFVAMQFCIDALAV